MKKVQLLLMLMAILALVATGCAKKTMQDQSQVEEQPDQTQAVAPQSSPAADTSAQADNDKAAELNRFLSEHVYFDFDSAVLRTDAQTTLRQKAEWLDGNRDLKALVIEGHCDERGTDAYNMALGARRADAVKQYLVDLGLEAGNFQTLSYGEERPMDNGHNEAAWAKNRRASFTVNQ